MVPHCGACICALANHSSVSCAKACAWFSAAGRRAHRHGRVVQQLLHSVLLAGPQGHGVELGGSRHDLQHALRVFDSIGVAELCFPEGDKHARVFCAFLCPSPARPAARDVCA